MGWIYEPRRPVDVRAAMDEDYGGAVRRSAIVGSVYYAAVQLPDRRIIAAVSLLDMDGPGFGHKDMSEDMGPHGACRCPVEILDMLTEPAPGPYAVAWRARCRAMAALEVAA